MEDGAAASRAAAVRGPDLGAPCPPSTAYHRAVEMNGYPVFAGDLPRDARGFAEKTCAFLLLLLPPLLPCRGRGRREDGVLQRPIDRESPQRFFAAFGLQGRHASSGAAATGRLEMKRQ